MRAFFSTFFTIFLCEIGSADQFALAAMASHSKSPFMILAAGVSAFVACSLLSIAFGGLISRLPINTDLVCGMVLLVTGVFFIWRA